MPSPAQVLALARTVARHPSAALALRSWTPFSTTSFEMARALRAQGLRPRTVIDGGANIGQFARAMAETFPAARVVSFEPHPTAAARFRTNLASCARVRLVEAALGSHDGTVTFHPQTYDLASSVLPAADAGAGALAPIEVPVGRLDTLLADEPLDGPVLLKLDLQGYELEALRGAPETLGRSTHVLFETAFRPGYVGEATFEDLYDLLRAAGFRFLRPVDVLRDAAGEIVQMDALFERVTAPAT